MQFILIYVISRFSHKLNVGINTSAVSDVKLLLEILREAKLLPTDQELVHLLEMDAVKKQLEELYTKIEEERFSEEYVFNMEQVHVKVGDATR